MVGLHSALITASVPPRLALMTSEQPEKQRVITGQTDDGQTFVVSDTGLAKADAPDSDPSEGNRPDPEDPEDAQGADEPQSHPTDQIEEPAKVMRIGTMVRKLLDEVKAAPLDDASRVRLSKIYDQSVTELGEGLSPELAEELQRIAEPFADGATPSDAELRIAQAQLVGWLEGLFQGIQTALFAQQMAARSQLEQMQRALTANTQSGHENPGPESGGLYL